MKHNIFIISDGTGGTAKRALKAALVQFGKTETETFLYPRVRDEAQVLEIISEARRKRGLIVHTLVSKKLRHFILEQARLNDVGTIDIMGPLLAQLSHNFENTPSEKPGIFEVLNKAYFQRIKAVEFTIHHDDGLRVEELDKADIVLLGVSRTFKTPLSVYLAHKGWLVANVPIILGFDLPDTVFKLNPDRVFCLTTFSRRLAELRKTRDNYLGGNTGDYADQQYVKKELNYASRIYRLHPKWNIINVTNKPIEEISSEILSILRTKNIYR
jgi:regulator of PEP synthase PpsR (kinase-PPPase family)